MPDLGGCVDSMMRASELSRLAFGRINALVGAVMDKAEPAAAGA